MDQPLVPQIDGIGAAIKRKRTQTSRRPRPEAQPLTDRSSTPVSDDMSKVSSDENNGDGNSGGKMLNVNQCVSRSLPVSGSDSGSNPILNNDVCDGTGSESRLKKVKLKVGGVTRTIQTKIGSNGAPGSVSSVKANQSVDNALPLQMPTPQENPDEYHSPSLGKKRGLQGIPWKDFSKGNFSIGKDDMGRTTSGKNNAFEKQGDNNNNNKNYDNNNKSDSVRKSKRAPKRRVMDTDFDDDDEDDEIRYLEKLKCSKMMGYRDLEAQPTRKLQTGGKLDNLEDVGRVGSKSRPGDMDYEEDEDPATNGDPEGKRKKIVLKKDLSELVTDNKREMALTTRQRALLSKDASASGASQIEFPNGLPPAPPRKQKEKLTEVEQQLKKAEAAQRRRIQNEKAARESEAEAIRKILGQDSSRKKREEKIKKRQEEMAQGKATNAHMLSSNTIRTVMGPTGTTVTFPQELGLPKIFDSKPCSYPPPREKCAGPFCTNDYKYRDSKLMLPLCSLQCYKAINDKLQAGKTC
ncbi:hypothetical protein CASFOL_009084 [Castilleja foliolosa]|uniref:INO80 complex subunit B-like conserved region domain-containing protein n=1 Tax=Castilleja foliolosa TaxID=1961234 RepID=A0ABD3E4W7_9LAMI